MQRIDVIKSGLGLGAASLVSALPTRSAAQVLSSAGGPAVNSISTSTQNYEHTLRWANAPTQDLFRPSGALTTHSGQLVTNVYHTFQRHHDNSVTHSHYISNWRVGRSVTDTTPWLTKPGSFRTSLGQLITVKSQSAGIIEYSKDGALWFVGVEQTAQYSITATMSSKNYYHQQVYTANAKSLNASVPPILTPDVFNPDNSCGACKFSPYGAVGATLGVAGVILGALIAPEVGAALALIAAGYDLYGLGVESGWWNGPGPIAP